MNIKRGQIHLVALDPVIGKEISKTRPVVIVSNDKNNAFSGTVTILPITSRKTQKIFPFEVYIDKGEADLPKVSKVKADQIRTLDKSRIIKFTGSLEKETIEKIDNALKIHLDLL